MSSDLQGISSCCLSGHLHNGKPEGQEVEIAGVKSYITGTNNAKTIMAIADIFGYQLNNIRLLADEIAQTGGFRVVVPDFLEGDPVDYKHLKTVTPQSSDPVPEDKDAQVAHAFEEVRPWLARHSDGQADELFAKVLTALRQDGAKKIGLIGFCWGGRHVLRLAGKSPERIEAVVANHPSYVEYPAVFDAVSVPTLIQIGDDDSFFPFEQVKDVKENIFAKKSDCNVLVYHDASHGFTNRSDQNNENEVKVKDEAAKAAIGFFKKHLA